MKALLMHPQRDFFRALELPATEPPLTQDLELETVWAAMAAGDRFLFEVARSGLLAGLNDPEVIVYRQDALRDCIANPDVLRRLYELAGRALETQGRVWRGLSDDSPRQVMHTSVAKLEVLTGFLRELRKFGDEHAASFSSRAFTSLFETVATELGDEYLDTVERHLAELRFPKGMVMSAQIGPGNKGVGYVLRESHTKRLLERLGIGGRFRSSFTIDERDVAGFRALEEIENKGLNAAAAALGEATDHVVGFFATLRSEAGFYVGCVNLHQRLARKGEPSCFPDPRPSGADALTARGLYDPALTLHLDGRAVPNDVHADAKSLVMVTGANQGGKSTFIRSVGLAQLMMQAGMFVCAESFSADVRGGVFTHFKREEDPTMTSGKLDEELGRMGDIADAIRPGGMLLCNESFASTNEQEGSEIARQIVRAMLDAGVKVLFVTHLYELARGFHADREPRALFLRAGRQPDGTRTFRLVEAEPLPTGYGADSYQRIFGEDREAEPAPAANLRRAGDLPDGRRFVAARCEPPARSNPPNPSSARKQECDT